MSWYDSDDYHLHSVFISNELDDELVNKFFNRYRELCPDNTDDEDLEDYFFSEEGLFSRYVSIDYRTVTVNSGPHPTSCYGPWNDCYYESEEFSIDGTNFEAIEKEIKEYMAMSDEDFTEEFCNV